MSGSTASLETGPLAADQMIAAVAALLATQMMFQSSAAPKISSDLVAKQLVNIGNVSNVPKSIISEAQTLLAGPSSGAIITNSIGVASNVLQQIAKAAAQAAPPLTPKPAPVSVPAPAAKTPIPKPVVRPVIHSSPPTVHRVGGRPLS